MACVDDEPDDERWVRDRDVPAEGDMGADDDQEIQLGELHALHLGRMIEISRGSYRLKGELLSVQHRWPPDRDPRVARTVLSGDWSDTKHITVTELTVGWPGKHPISDKQRITVNDYSDTRAILVRHVTEPCVDIDDMALNAPNPDPGSPGHSQPGGPS
jgi:hypothetical protein